MVPSFAREFRLVRSQTDEDLNQPVNHIRVQLKCLSTKNRRSGSSAIPTYFVRRATIVTLDVMSKRDETLIRLMQNSRRIHSKQRKSNGNEGEEKRRTLVCSSFSSSPLRSLRRDRSWTCRPSAWLCSTFPTILRTERRRLAIQPRSSSRHCRRRCSIYCSTIPECC